MNTHKTRAAALAAAMVLIVSGDLLAGDLPPGIVTEKPAEGRFVEITDGEHKGRFMVAYTETITTPLNKTIAIEFEPIPGGVFEMGSPEGEEGRDKSEGPRVAVAVDAMWIGKHEMTWDQFDPWIDLYTPLKDNQIDRTIPAGREADAVSVPTLIWADKALPIIQAMGREGGYPASHMTQLNARQFTKFLSARSGRFYRIPTEAEWEYAARAGTTTAYSFGDDPEVLAEHAIYFDNSHWDEQDRGHPQLHQGYRKVGERKPNAWGLYDMHGNVAEWCIDEVVAGHYAKLAEKAGGKPVHYLDAIAWPRKPYGRVLRGGHWDSNPEGCRSASRLADTKEWKEHDPQIPQSVWFFTEFWFGFRPLRPLHEPGMELRQRFWEPDVEQWLEYLKESKQVRFLPVGPAGEGAKP